MSNPQSEPFKNGFKGQLAEVLVRFILEKAGYKVKSLGIQNVVPAVKEKAGQDIRDSHPALRHLPDFSVYDPEGEKLWLLEVKYRSDLNLKRVVAAVVEKQLPHYAPLVLVVASKRCMDGDPENPANFVGALELDDSDEGKGTAATVNGKSWKEGDDIPWKKVKPLGDVFKRLSGMEETRLQENGLELLGSMFDFKSK